MEAQTQSGAQRKVPSTLALRPVPDDFPQRMASKIMVTLERERDPDRGLQQIASLIVRHMGHRDRVKYFVDAIDVLLEDEEAKRYAALAYMSVALDSNSNSTHKHFLDNVVDLLVYDHMHMAKPEIQLENTGTSFSMVARHLGEVFTRMIDMNSDLYEVISLIFSIVVRKEIAIQQARQEASESASRRMLSTNKNEPQAAKKLFDEVIDYIHARGQFHSDSLNQQNPNEYMGLLADRLRGSRRYVVQDIINRQALEKKKEVEKELSERLANAEEVILARDSFKKALYLFWMEKLYNFKYISVEKVRITLQVLAIVEGIAVFLMGYLGMFSLAWWEGLVVAFGMYVFAMVMCSQKAFRRYFPEDVIKELEVVVGAVTPIMRKMSKDQLEAFLTRQARDPANLALLALLPEFVRYLFDVMPERKTAIVNLEQLADIMSTVELDIARTLRDAAPSRVLP